METPHQRNKTEIMDFRGALPRQMSNRIRFRTAATVQFMVHTVCLDSIFCISLKI
jgi:hypothetical protein